MIGIDSDLFTINSKARPKCVDCGKTLSVDDYICCRDPLENPTAKHPRRTNLCKRCYKQRLYDIGFCKGSKKKKKKKSSKGCSCDPIYYDNDSTNNIDDIYDEYIDYEEDRNVR